MINRNLAFVVLLLLIGSFAVVISSSAQNANSSTPVTKNQNDARQAPGGQQQDFSKNTWDLPTDAEKTKNPTPSTPESVAKGKELYLERTKGNCVFCHGETGSGN